MHAGLIALGIVVAIVVLAAALCNVAADDKGVMIVTELKPCPFCGSKAIMRMTKHIPKGFEYTPQCANASCAGRLTKKWLDKDGAMYAWNKRTNQDTACSAWQSCWNDLKNRKAGDD